MKSYLITFFIILSLTVLILTCSSPKHYHKGNSFINDPDLDEFGATFEKKNNQYLIKSYFRSSIINRTEYIYENLNLTIPKSIGLKEKIKIPDDRITFWYAKGGQAGQIETAHASGYITLISITETDIQIEVNLTFNNFEQKGSFNKSIGSIHRKGTLTAKKGYKLYP